MKAARLFGPGDLRVVDVPIRPLEPQEVLCRVVRCGVCGTDASIYTGEASFVKQGLVPFPMTPGHEWSGVVEQVGAAVDRLQAGDRVVGDDEVSCGSCPECLQGDPYGCRRLRPVGTIQAWDGAYAEYIIMPERHLFPVPEAVDFDSAALAEPAANAYNCVRQAGVAAGSTVLVHGTGPVGLMSVRLAKAAGAARVLISGRRRWKLEAARSLGADLTIDTTGQSVGAVVREHCGDRGVDCVIEASGAVELLRESVGLVRPEGTIALIAFYEAPIERFDLDRLICGGVSLRPVRGGLRAIEPVLELMRAGQADFRALITGRYPLAEAQRALAEHVHSREAHIKLMLDVQPPRGALRQPLPRRSQS